MINTLTTKEVARNFNVETETVRRWLRNGKIKAKKINGHYLILEQEMIDFFLGNQAKSYGMTTEQLKAILDEFSKNSNVGDEKNKSTVNDNKSNNLNKANS